MASAFGNDPVGFLKRKRPKCHSRETISVFGFPSHAPPLPPGAEVFDRSTRPLTLTESGRIFFEAEKRVAEIREDCRRAVEDINGGGRGRVVIGASEYREMFFLTEELPVFSTAHPGIEITLEEGTTRELEDFVWTRKTDMSLIVSQLVKRRVKTLQNLGKPGLRTVLAT